MMSDEHLESLDQLCRALCSVGGISSCRGEPLAGDLVGEHDLWFDGGAIDIPRVGLRIFTLSDRARVIQLTDGSVLAGTRWPAVNLVVEVPSGHLKVGPASRPPLEHRVAKELHEDVPEPVRRACWWHVWDLQELAEEIHSIFDSPLAERLSPIETAGVSIARIRKKNRPWLDVVLECGEFVEG